MASTEFPSVGTRQRQPRTAYETCRTDGHLRSGLHQVKEQTKLTLFKRNRHRTKWRVGLLQGLHSLRRSEGATGAGFAPGSYREGLRGVTATAAPKGHYTPPWSQRGARSTLRPILWATWNEAEFTLIDERITSQNRRTVCTSYTPSDLRRRKTDTQPNPFRRWRFGSYLCSAFGRSRVRISRWRGRCRSRAFRNRYKSWLVF